MGSRRVKRCVPFRKPQLLAPVNPRFLLRVGPVGCDRSRSYYDPLNKDRD